LQGSGSFDFRESAVATSILGGYWIELEKGFSVGLPMLCLASKAEGIDAVASLFVDPMSEEKGRGFLDSFPCPCFEGMDVRVFGPLLGEEFHVRLPSTLKRRGSLSRLGQ
jgi:hypothetical protein